MEARSDRAGRDSELTSYARHRPVQPVVQHHHSTVLRRQPSQSALDCVTVDDCSRSILLRRVLFTRSTAAAGSGGSRASSLGVAGVYQHATRPCIEGLRIAEARKVQPDRQQRSLRCVVGKVTVAQDATRSRAEPLRDGVGEGCEGVVVPALSSGDQRAIHVDTVVLPRANRIGAPTEAALGVSPEAAFGVVVAP